ncbi:MAG: transposase [Pyrinomonadaceae bacterium]|nr:transposase [Pyrinomonadaceae bacterium]
MDPTLLAPIDLAAIPDPGARQAIQGLLNLVEQLAAENRALRDENQRLRDENDRLKGERGKPTFRSAKPSAGSTDYSSERERRQPGTWQKGPKRDRITITRTERLTVDRASLPPDAEYKGVETVVVQDVRLEVNGVCFEKEVWYSPSLRKSYRASLPAGYDGEFGPGLKALALALHYAANVTQPKLRELFEQAGVVISSGYLADLLSQDRADFKTEATAVFQAGLRSSPWHHLDDTRTRVDGQSEHCHVIGNPLYTAYLTTPRKDRLTVLDVLRGGTERRFRLDAVAERYLEWVGLSASARRRLAAFPRDQDLDEATILGLLDAQRLWLGPQQRTWILEALALAAYQAQDTWPVVQTLVCDDAPQFRGVTDELALCWIHEGRHYTKLSPYLPRHQTLLAAFKGRFWAYYRELLAYREHPSADERTRLGAAFDALFATETGYRLLDERIALTRTKKDSLLLVLDHPELPLHNNPAELAARQRVRKRDASFGPRSPAGRAAWDTFHTLAATTHKLGLSLYAYLRDRLAHAGQVPPLADLITARAPALHLGASWAAS